jgi:hypothetical protein
MSESEDPFEQVLREAAPATRADSVSDDALHAMIAGIPDEDARQTRRGHGVRGAAIGTLIVLSLVGVGSAAARILPVEWQPWAVEEAHGSMEYELPSGEWCEYRWGNFAGDPDAVAAAERIATGGKLPRLDMDEEIERARATTTYTQVIPGGPDEPGGFGTKYWDADMEYQSVLGTAMNELLLAALEREGFEHEALTSIDGETHCGESR